jgi:uncharacterized protein YlxW (UPF0749 family)
MPDRAPLPPHVTMPLLDVVIRNSLDQDYQHVAAVRVATGETREGSALHWRALVVVGLFGLLLVIAAVQSRASAGTEALAREQLVQQIDNRRTDLLSAEREVGELRDEISTLTARQARLVRTEQTEAAANLRLRGITGFAPVAGQGVKITLDNAPGGDRDGAVTDEDLALLIDGLWAAGAEAIAVNGRRLTVTTGIRTAGSAIQIHDRALLPPYTIQAIGNRNTLQSRFVETSSGLGFLNLRARFGFHFHMQNDKTIRLPAAPRPDLVRATRARTDPRTQEVSP